MALSVHDTMILLRSQRILGEIQCLGQMVGFRSLLNINSLVQLCSKQTEILGSHLQVHENYGSSLPFLASLKHHPPVKNWEGTGMAVGRMFQRCSGQVRTISHWALKTLKSLPTHGIFWSPKQQCDTPEKSVGWWGREHAEGSREHSLSSQMAELRCCWPMCLAMTFFNNRHEKQHSTREFTYPIYIYICQRGKPRL